MRVGIVGGGQLAMMLAEAAKPLGVNVLCLEKESSCPAARVTKIIQGDYEDQKALQALVAESDVLTYEFENVVPASLEIFQTQISIYPPVEALRKTQDRFLEKSFLNSLAIPTVKFKAVSSLAELKKAVIDIGYPCVLKTRRGGYDGKGQWILKSAEDCIEVESVVQNTPCILEAWASFDRELSIIAVRSTTGELAFYPLVENRHEAGILRESKAPFEDPPLQSQAENYVRAVLKALQYVGVICIEFFQQGARLTANEMAPRVHNSGHWSIEGAKTSQFENHLRAILGLKLGSTQAIGYSEMRNLIGELPAERPEAPGTYWHLYGKEPKPGRKLGHVTRVG